MQALEILQKRANFLENPYVDLSFPVMGETWPADHGYGLYAALTHWNETIHDLEDLSIQTIMGIPDHKGKIYLTEQSRLRLRVPSNRVPLLYGLAGQRLSIGDHHIRLGIPQIYVLKPIPQLQARIVVIKGYQEPESFLQAALRQLEALEIQGTVIIPVDEQGEAERKIIKIKQFTVVGFRLGVFDLNEEDSLKLQIEGLGGKRRMGCGIFIPLS